MCDCQFCRFDGDAGRFPVPVRFRDPFDQCFVAWALDEDTFKAKWSASGPVSTHATLYEVVVSANAHFSLAMPAEWMARAAMAAEIPKSSAKPRRFFVRDVRELRAARASARPAFGRKALCSAGARRRLVQVAPTTPTPPRPVRVTGKRGRDSDEGFHDPSVVEAYVDRVMSKTHSGRSEVCEMLKEKSLRWDAQVVKVLLELGATPVLSSVRPSSVQCYGKAMVECVFETLVGDLTDHILLPRGLVAYVYKRKL